MNNYGHRLLFSSTTARRAIANFESAEISLAAQEVEIAIEFGYCLACWIIPKMDFYEWP
ncbi:MAG TPA: hypothetical protein VIS99_04070 [Terrimicrobiaceae bacterium]